jgi:small conductance mechanosensitive channel
MVASFSGVVLHAACQALVSTQAAATSPAASAPAPVAQATQEIAASSAQAFAMFEKYGLPAVKALALLLIGFVIAGWIAGLVRKTCDKAKLDITLGRFLGAIAKWAIVAAVVIMCLSSFGVQVTSFVAILGSIGVAIGLALQGSLSHIAAGVMLLIFRPFKVGDFVTAGGQTGAVDEISLFSTVINTPDNRKIIVPNGAIVSGVITNATAYDMRVAEVAIHADAGGDVERERATLQSVATGIKGRISDKPAAVALTAMGATNVWSVSVWCRTAELDSVRENLLIACNKAVGQAGLAPPAPVSLVRNV